MVTTDFWQQWVNSHVALEKDTEWLGENGWTIPLWADPGIVSRLRNASGDIDKAFVHWYTADDNKRLKELWKRLRNSKGLCRWGEVIEQTIDSYLDRRFAVVVPCLLIVLEGSVAHGADDLRKLVSNPKKSATRKREETEVGMRRLIWISIESFITQIFGKAPFSENRPIKLNRHWVLHGRDTKAWGLPRESIRLFHAIDTISTTVDRRR
ncbi:MAG: hypothetical protein ACYDIB_07655 [Desulfobulbia bacterium]